MQINSTIQAVAGAYSLNTSMPLRKTVASEAVSARDEVRISREAQSFSSMLQELKGMDDVREDKVELFSQAIAAGTYDVPAKDIAARMLASRF